ncbi:hypothetical protein ACIGHF_17440 [Stenotrophomonas sp. NPDC077464]|uniref:hypothetical protein n=1 Tax=unclassified Stenotrophomonas TaxID=196198 RepID=UPI0037D4047B
MPVPTSPDVLSPMLSRRLEASLPLEHRISAVEALRYLLTSVRNVPPVTHTPPPLDRTNPWPMARVFQCLTQPGAGAEQGPLSAAECHTVHTVHYLYEVHSAPSLDRIPLTAGRWPQAAIHARVLNQVRREFAQLPHPQPFEGWEKSVHDVSARLMAQSLDLGLQPTEVVVVASQEVPPEARRHLGGVTLHLAAWNAATPPPECTPETANPNVWDPSNPLGNEPDLRRAPLQLEWTGITPLLPGQARAGHSAGTPISVNSAGAG